MKVEDLVDRLLKCGLDEKEAQAFVHLTTLGQTKVTELAKAAGLRRADAYTVLDRLQGRGLVEATLTRPRLYQAVDGERAIAALIEERERALGTVNRMRDDLVDGLHRLGGDAATQGAQGGFRILHDQNQIRGQVSRSLRRARREVALVASSRGLQRLLHEGLDADLKEAAERGVKVRILTEILPGHEDAATHVPADVRHLLIPRPLRFVLVDDHEIIQYVHADPLAGGKETALWIGASDYVQAQRAFLDDLWADALRADARLKEIQTGRTPEQARLVRGRFTRYEKEKDMILRAEETLDLVLGERDAQLLDKSGLRRLLEQRAKDGVHIRILTHAEHTVAVKGAETRPAPSTLTGLTWVLADAREALLVFQGRDAGDRLTALEEAAAWVTMEETARAHQALFNEHWTRAEP